MCLFNFPNHVSIKALEKGLEMFECGSCPECLQKKSRLWALRCSMESLVTYGVMVTLTYDKYKVKYGKQSEEEIPTDPTIPLSKKHCQDFIKRLRSKFYPAKIKYILTAERGKRTGRAHYHALLFGVQFDDLVKYKKSDRGNWIYKSQTLEKIWKFGICTVDCINLSAKVARYCTKYCSKDSGADDTFMLFSRGIGEQKLLEKFNGKSYWIDGREYSIPKQIWQKVIEERYNIDGYSRYIPKRKLVDIEKILYNALKKKNAKQIWQDRLNELLRTNLNHAEGKRRNDIYCEFRDNDTQYQEYIAYWHEKSRTYEKTRPTVEERILALPENKYRSYKRKSLIAKSLQINNIGIVPPRSNITGLLKIKPKKKEYQEKTFAPLSRHYWANDRIRNELQEEYNILKRLRRYFLIDLPMLNARERLDPILDPFSMAYDSLMSS